jgi:hypothetical protein
MSTTTTIDAGDQKTNLSMVSTSSKNPQQTTPQISIRDGLPTSVDDPTASGSVAPGEPKDSFRPTDTLTMAPKNSHESLKKRLKANADAALDGWLERKEAQTLRRERRKDGSK